MPEHLPKDHSGLHRSKKDYLQISEAANFLDVSIDTIRRWDRAGKLSSYRLDGKNRYFLKTDLESFRRTLPLTISQTATMLGVSASTLRRLEDKGVLTAGRNSRGERVYEQSDVEAFLKNKQTKGKQKHGHPVTNTVIHTSGEVSTLSQGVRQSDQSIKYEMSSLEEAEPKQEDVSPYAQPEINTENTAETPLVFFTPEKVRELHETPVSAHIQAQNVPVATNLSDTETGYVRPRAQRTILSVVKHADFFVTHKKTMFLSLFFLILCGSLYGYTQLPLKQSKKSLTASPTAQAQVLAESTKQLKASLNFNIPVLLKKDLTVDGTSLFTKPVTVQDSDLTVENGRVIAPNLLYSLTAGSNITITGDQDLTISASLPNSVLSFQGQTGEIALAAGSGISVDGLTIANTDRGSNQNIFKTINIDGTEFAAGSNTDTLRFTAGAGIVLATDTGNKNITISSSATAPGWVDDGTAVRLETITDLVGIGTATPNQKLEIMDTTSSQLRLAYDTSHYSNFKSDSSGNLTITTTGSTVSFPGLTVAAANFSCGDCITFDSIADTLTLDGNLAINASASNYSLNIDAGTLFVDTANNRVGIGTITPSQALDINGNLAVSGTTKFGGLDYTWPTSDGTDGYVLTTNGSGALTWTDASGIAASTNYFAQANGVTYAKDFAMDFLIGGSATTSAKFAILNMSSGTPTASVSGQTGAIYLNANGKLATTNRQPITIGDSNSGDVSIANNTTFGGNLTFGGTTFSSLTGNGLTTSSNALTLKLTASGTSGEKSSNSGLELSTDGIGLLRGCFNGQILKWNSDTGLWECNADVGGLSSAVVSIQEGGSPVTSTADTLNFNGNDFSLTEEPAGTVNINIDYANSHITRDNQIATISAAWNFTDTLLGTTINASTALQTAGTTRINASGNLVNIGTTQFNGVTYTWPASVTNGYVLQTNGSGTLAWVDPGGFGPFTNSDGVIYPKILTQDFLLGGSATDSAKFGLINITSGTPTASIAAGLNGGTYLTATGTLATTAMQQLTIGGDTTGNIVITPQNGAGTVTVSGLSTGVVINTNGVLSSEAKLAVDRGGTGASSFANGRLLVGNGTSAITTVDYSSWDTNAGDDVTTFLGLTDTPSTYTGSGSYVVRVDAGGTGLEFVDASSWDTNADDDQPLDDTLTALAGVTTSADKLIYATGTDAFSTTGFTNFARSLLDDSDASSVRSTLGLVIGTDVQAYNANTTILGNTIELGSEVTGTLGVGNGGTGKNLTLAAGGIVWTDTDSFEVSAAGSPGQILKSNGANTPTWIDASSVGTNYWQRNLGTVAPINITDDLLLGATATTSAKIALFNIASGTPKVSISATTTALSLSGDGVISTTNDHTLTLGSASTGNIQFYSSSNSLTSSGNLTLVGKINGASLSGGSLTGGTYTATGLSVSGGFIAALGNNNTFSITDGTNTLFSVSDNGTNGYGLFDNSGELRFGDTGGSNYTGFKAPSSLDNNYLYTLPNPTSLASVNGYVLQTDNTGVLSWINPSNLGTNYFTLNQTDGTVYPTNATLDFLIGGTSTSSANFAFINGATPTASISGNIVLNGARSIQSTRNNSLTFGGDTTGNLYIAPQNGVVGGYLAPTTDSSIDLGTPSLTFRTLYAQQVIPVLTGTQGYIQRNDHALSPTFVTDDFLLGGTATNSALIRFGGTADAKSFFNTGGNVGIGITDPIALLDVRGAIHVGSNSNANDVLNIAAAGDSPSGDLYWGNETICTSGGSCSGGAGGGTITAVGNMASGNVFADNTASGHWLGLGSTDGRIEFDNQTIDEVNILGAKLGLGTSTPSTYLTVSNSGLTPSGQALAIFDQYELQDVLTASASGTTVLTLARNGNLTVAGTVNNATISGGTLAANKLTLTGGSFEGATVTGGTIQGGTLSGGTYADTGATVTGDFNVTQGNNKTFRVTDGSNTLLSLVDNGNAGTLSVDTITTTGDINGLDLNEDTDSFNIVGGSTTARTLTVSGGNISLNQSLSTSSSPLFSTISLSGVSDGVIIKNGGALTSEPALDEVRGGTGISSYTQGDLLFASNSTSLSKLGIGTSGYVLASNGTQPAWTNINDLTTFTSQNGAIYLNNTTQDFLLGGTATDSAKFAVLNMNSSTPVASLSAGTTGLALSGDGSLQALNMNTLTLGGNTTGLVSFGSNIKLGSDTLSDFTGDGLTVSNGALSLKLAAAGTSSTTQSGSGLEFNNGALTLLQGCSDSDVLNWNGTVWQCAAVTGIGGAGDITAVGNVTNGAAFTGNDTGNTLYFEGSTEDSFEIALTAEDPGLDYTITLPAISGKVILDAGTQTISGAKSFTSTSGLTIGEDKTTGTNNTRGTLKLISGGDTAYSTIFRTGVQTSLSDIIYTLPLAQGAETTVLVNDGLGNLSWETVSGAGGGSVTGVGSMNTSVPFSSSAADGDCLGLTGSCGSTTDGFIGFTNSSPDQIYLNNARVGIGTTNPSTFLHVANSTQPAVGKALAIFDQYEAQDILTASASGTTKLALNRSGDLTLAGNLAVNGGDITTTATQMNFRIGDNGTYIFYDSEDNNMFSIDDDGTNGVVRVKNQGKLRFEEATANGTNGIEFMAPSDLAGDITYTWPGAEGASGAVLTTNGSGTLSWTPSTSINYWQRPTATGAVAPLNITDDFLLGGTSTASAKVAITNMATGTPNLYINGTVNNLALAKTSGGFTIAGGDTSHTLTVSGNNVSLNQNLTTDSSPTFDGLTIGSIALDATGPDSLTSGAHLIGVNTTGFTKSSATTVQGVLADLDAAVGTAGTAQNVFNAFTGDTGTTTADSPTDTLTINGSGSVSTAISGDTLTITGVDTNTTYTAGNGLSLLGTEFDLGGTLEKATDIALDGNNFSFSGTGNVGIGTTSPVGKLNISGTMSQASGDILYLDTVFTSSGTANHGGITSFPTFDLTASTTVANVRGIYSYPIIAGSANDPTVTQYAGLAGKIGTNSDYSGTVTNAYAINAEAPYIGGSYFYKYAGLHVDTVNSTASQNSGNTSGTINNYGLLVEQFLAAAGSGGALNNYGGYINVPNGSGTNGITNNYGLYISGNSTFGDSNYSLYNASTATTYFAGRVGVGTSSPGYALDVNGTGNISGETTLGSTLNVTGATTLASTLGVTGNTTLTGDLAVNGGDITSTGSISITPSSNLNITIPTNNSFAINTNEFFLADNGDVGIGTTSPNAKLDVRGHIYIGAFSPPIDTTGKLYSTGSDLFWNGTKLNSASAAGGQFSAADGLIFPTNTTQDFALGGTSTASAKFAVLNMNSGTPVVYTSGNIGIGTTTPNNKLQVADLINFDNSNKSTYIGYQAGNSNNGFSNTVLGYQALFNTTSGDYNTALGSFALYENIDGLINTAVGESALYSNTSGNYNTAFGSSAGYNNQTGSNNTLFGYAAGLGTYGYSFSNNTIFGHRSGLQLTTGSNNILMGYQAGDNITSGSNNIIIGYNIDATTTTTNNFLNIGNTIYGDLTSGSIGLGTTSPNEKLDLRGALYLGDTTAPGTTTNRLYAVSGDLFWNGTQLNAAAAGGQFSAADGLIFPNNTTMDFALGGTSTASAKFAVLNMNSGTPVVYTSGNIGIGITDPTQKLDIAGKVAINGNQVLYLPDQANFNGTLIIGDGGGSLNTTGFLSGEQNTFVGISAGRVNTIGNLNSFFGFSSGYSNTTGNNNSFFGRSSGYSNSSGANNTFIGTEAGYDNSSGNSNVAIGYGSGFNNVSGSNNIFLGYQAGYDETGSNKLYIENSNSTTPLIWGDFASDLVGINGNLGIGTTAPNSKLDSLSTTGSQLRLSYDTSKYAGFTVDSNGKLTIATQTGLELTGDGITASSFTCSAGDCINFGEIKDIMTLDGDWTITPDNTTPYFFLKSSDGNVGIGTTAPGAKLDVNGNTNMSGTLTLQNSNTLTGVTSYTNFSGGIGLGSTTSAPTYYINSSGTGNLNALTLAGELNLAALSSSASTTEGAVYYDTDDDQLKVYANGKWQADRSSATVIVAASDSKNKEKADYVADGSGGTDDASTIESAIAALPSTGGSVVLLDGTFSLDSSVDVTKSNVTITGTGKATVLQRNFDSSIGVYAGELTLGNGGTTAVDNVTIANVYLDGNKSSYTGSYNTGIFLNQNLTNIKLLGLTITNHTNDGIKGTSTSTKRIDYVTIADSTIQFNGSDGIDTSANTSFWTVRNNTISRNTSRAFYLAGSGTNASSSAVLNNTIEFNSFYAIDVNTADSMTISGNTINNNSSVGIYLTTVTNSSVTSNTVNKGTYGINLSASSNNSISSNVINNVSIYGFNIAGNSSNNTLSNNMINASSSNGVYIASGSQYNTFTGNTIKGSGSNGVSVAGSYNTVSGNNIYDATGTGISISADYNMVIGNSLTANSGGISISSASNNTVSNNRIDDTSSSFDSGVTLSNASNNTITDNTITDTAGFGYAINIAGSGNTSNILKGNIYSGTGASNIADTGTGTQYLGQLNSSGANMVFNPSGNFGIGTTAPLAKLDVNGTASLSGNLTFAGGAQTIAATSMNALTLGDASTGNIIFNPAGNIGIGTTAPTYKFDLLSTSATQLRLGYDTSNYFTTAISSIGLVSFDAFGTGSGFNFKDALYLGSDEVTDGSLTFYSSGAGKTDPSISANSSGNLTITAPDGIVDIGNGIGDITLDPGSNNLVANLSSSGNFLIQDNGTAFATFDHTGNIGIGTTTPLTKFHLNTTTVGKALAIFNETSGGNDIFTASSAGTTRFVINKDGNVGIGTTTPNAKLNIADNTAGYAANLTQANTGGSLIYGWLNSTSNTQDLLKLDNSSSVAFNIKASGNIGIGTTTPGAKLSFGAATSAAGGIDFGGDAALYRSGLGELTTNASLKFSGVTYDFTSGTNEDITFLPNGTGDLVFGTDSTSSQFFFDADKTVNLYSPTASTLRTNGSFISDGNIGIGITSPGNKLALASTSSLASVDTGTNVIANGNFASSTGWTFGTGWSYDGAGLKATATSANGTLTKATTDVAGTVYKITFDVTRTAGSLSVELGSLDTGVTISASGSQTIYSYAGGTNGTLTITGSGFTGSIDNVVINPLSSTLADVLIQSSDGTNTPLEMRSGGNFKNNTFIGYSSGQNNTTGNSNSFFGSSAGRSNTTGGSNSFLGVNTGIFNTTGSQNVFLGSYAGYLSTTGSNNIFLGYRAGQSNTSGNNNLYLGHNAGYNSQTGSGNVFLGYQAGYNETGSNKLYIENSNSSSPLIYGDFSSDIVSINGNLGIGTTTPSNSLQISGGSLCVKSGAGSCAGSTAGTIYATTTTISGADYAENYISANTLEKGEIVISSTDGNNKAVERSNTPYQSRIIGVVSTDPGVTLNSDAQTDSQHPYIYPIGILGRVPVKVTNQNGQIKKGDPLTASTLSGVAMKATQAGTILGTALEDYSGTGVGSIMVYVNITWFDPQVQIASNGDVQLNQEANGNWLAIGSDGNIIDKQDAFAKATIANLKVGKLNGQDIFGVNLAATNGVFDNLNASFLTSDSLTINDTLSAGKITTDELSFADFKVVQNNDKLEFRTGNASGSAVIAFTKTGDATFSGKLTAKAVKADEGDIETLHVKNLIVDNISGLTASSSALFDLGEGIQADFGEFDFAKINTDLTVLGTTTLREAAIQDSLSVGAGELTINSGSINTVSQPLEIQSLKQQPVTLMAGAVTFNTDGTVKFSENVAFEKNVSVKGDLVAKTIRGVNDVLNVSGSAQFEKIGVDAPEVLAVSNNVVNASGSAGLVTLKSGQTSVRINNDKVTDKSMIFITPKGSTYGQQLYVKSQVDGQYFIVQVDAAITKDIDFNFLIVN